MSIETKTTQERIVRLAASNNSTNQYLSDQLLKRYGTNRKSEIIGKIGNNGQPYQELLNGNLTTGYISNSGVLLEDFETVGDWTVSGAGATVEADATNFRTGTKGLKVTSVNAVAAVARKNVSLDLSTTEVFSIWTYIHDLTKITTSGFSHLFFYTGAADAYSVSLFSPHLSLQTGWNKLLVHKNDFVVATGTPNWANSVVQIRIRCLSLAGETASLTVDELRIGEQSRPKIIVTFDDGNATDYTEAYSYMESKGLKGILFVPAANVGEVNQITLAQMQEMYADGWDMGNHSYNHIDLTDLTYEEALEEIASDTAYLVTNGMSRGSNFLAYPLSALNATVVQAAIDAGIILARSGVAGVNAHDNPLKLKLKRREALNTSLLSDFTGWIDNCIDTGGVLIFNFHDIVTPAVAGTNCTVEIFQGVIDYLKTKVDADALDVVTMTEWYTGLT